MNNSPRSFLRNIISEPSERYLSAIFRFVEVLILLLSLTVFLQSSGYSMPEPEGAKDSVFLTQAKLSIDNKPAIDYQLSGKLRNLSGKSKVSLSFTLDPGGELKDIIKNDNLELYFRSVYAPMKIYKIYLNGNVLKEYEYGQAGTYPGCFFDPSAMAETIPLSDLSSLKELRFEYQSPLSRDNIMLYAPIIGTRTAIYSYLFRAFGFSLILSVIYILTGTILVFSSLFFIPIREKFENQLSEKNVDFQTFIGAASSVTNGTLMPGGIRSKNEEVFGGFLRLPGLLFLLVGIWGFGENTLSLFLIRKPAMMYILSFFGLFSLTIPLLDLTSVLLDLHFDPFIFPFRILLRLSLCIAVLLQLLGILQFSQSMYYFHVLIPLAIISNLIAVILQWIKHNSRMAKLLFFGYILLAASAILEVANYYLEIMWHFSAIFQIGVFGFMAYCFGLSLLYLKNSYNVSLKASITRQELRFLEKSIELQKERNALLISGAENIRRQRHDLRHRINAIRGYLDSGKTEELKDYLNKYSKQILSESQKSQKVYCQNLVANTVISHYVEIAEKEGIETSINAFIPEKTKFVSDGALCVILGNLLENAVEACGRMQNGKARFIRFDSSVQGEMLFISMDNSSDGIFRLENGTAYSCKRENRLGVGLSSIRSIAKSHDGDAYFSQKEGFFRSEVYLKL